MSESLVSVIIPVLNGASTLAASVRSVQNQTYSHWECLIIDDNSVDASMDISLSLLEKDPRIKYFRNARRQGVSFSRNRGLEKAQGKYIQFLDADDFLEPDKFKVQVDILEREAQVDVVYSDVKHLDTRSKEAFKSDTLPVKVDPSPIDYLVKGNFNVIHSPLSRTATIRRMGGFDSRLNAMEDWDLWLRVAINGGRFLYHPAQNTDVIYVKHEHNTSANFYKMFRGCILVRKKLENEQMLNSKLLELNGTLIRDTKKMYPLYAYRDLVYERFTFGKLIQLTMFTRYTLNLYPIRLGLQAIVLILLRRTSRFKKYILN